MKKLKYYITLLTISTILIPNSTYGCHLNQEFTQKIIPLFDYINQMNSSLSINAKGIASATGYTRTMTGEKVALTVKLQQYKSGNWNTLYSWSDEDLYSCTIQKERAVEEGYSYRVETTGKVYDTTGKLLESQTVTSQTEYY